MSPNAPGQGQEGGGPRVSPTQAALWTIAFAIVIALIVFYFLYGSAARPLLGAAGDIGSVAAWPLS